MVRESVLFGASFTLLPTMRTLAVALAVGLLAAACSGDDDVATTTAPVITSDTLFVTTTTESPTTTVTDPTTVPSSTAPGTTTLAPATAAPPSTKPELDEARSAVIAAVSEADEVVRAIRLDPSNPDLAARMQGVLTDNRQRWVVDTFVVHYVANNLEERPNPGVPETLEIDVDSFVLTEDDQGPLATVVTCSVRSNLLYQLGAGPDGSDVLQDDTVVTLEARIWLRVIDGAWLVDDGEDLELTQGVQQCE